MKTSHTLTMVCLLGAAVSFGSAQAGTDELVKNCETCHGAGGNGDDLKVPNIAGMSEVYLNDTMTAYKSGDRPAGSKYKPKDGEESDMAMVAKKLSEGDIEAVAAHFAGQTFRPHAQQVDAALAAKGKAAFDEGCEKCHSEGGSVAADDAGVIAGQGKPYLEEQFKMYDDGLRPMPKKMKKKFEALSGDDKAAIIEFLAGGGK